MKRNCIVCRKEIENSIVNDEESYLPADGIIATSRGNFGSKIFDPIANENQRLEFVVCDECLVTNYKNINVVETRQIIESDVQTLGKYLNLE